MTLIKSAMERLARYVGLLPRPPVRALPAVRIGLREPTPEQVSTCQTCGRRVFLTCAGWTHWEVIDPAPGHRRGTNASYDHRREGHLMARLPHEAARFPTAAAAAAALAAEPHAGIQLSGEACRTKPAKQLSACRDYRTTAGPERGRVAGPAANRHAATIGASALEVLEVISDG